MQPVRPAARKTKTAEMTKTSDSHLPAGWARFSYGSLSVGAPSGWKVRSAPLSCGSPPNTVNEYTLNTLRSTSCPSFGPGSPTVEAVVVVFLPINFSPLPTLGAEILATVEPTGKPC